MVGLYVSGIAAIYKIFERLRVDIFRQGKTFKTDNESYFKANIKSSI
jgi:hypothetical protein